MELIRVVTKNFVYSRGLRLPVPPGFSEEPVIVDRMAILDADDGSIVRMVCIPEEGRAPEDWIQDGLVFVVDVMIGEEVRLEYLTTVETIAAIEEEALRAQADEILRQEEAEAEMRHAQAEELEAEMRHAQAEEMDMRRARAENTPVPLPFGPGPSERLPDPPSIIEVTAKAKTRKSRSVAKSPEVPPPAPEALDSPAVDPAPDAPEPEPPHA